MLVFLDESGDDGVQQKPGTSDYFLVGAVIFRDPQSAERCESAIREFRRSQLLPERFEFHFSKSSRKLRLGFLKHVASQDFTFCTYVVNKTPDLRSVCSTKHEFYGLMVTYAVERLAARVRDATLIVDKSGGQEFHSELCRFVRRRMTHAYAENFRKVKMQDSSRNDLLQLADMVCGAVGRAGKAEKLDRSDYLECIRHKAAEMHVWP